jgi:hypothetical protein
VCDLLKKEHLSYLKELLVLTFMLFEQIKKMKSYFNKKTLLITTYKNKKEKLKKNKSNMEKKKIKDLRNQQKNETSKNQRNQR